MGPRVPITYQLPNDSTSPTRGLFVTSHRPIRYADITWPFGILPQGFLSVKARQTTPHYHVAILLCYFSKCPNSLRRKLQLHCFECDRIKTDWVHITNYLRLQSIQILDCVLNDPCIANWKDYTRTMNRAEAAQIEARTNGLPLVFANHTPRSATW